MARWHIGVIAQQVKDAFESEGLDPFCVWHLCYDEWDAEEEVLDDNGTVINNKREAGNRYGVRLRGSPHFRMCIYVLK